MWKIRYDWLRKSIFHHMIEATDTRNALMVSTLYCVLWGAHAARFPEGDPRRDQAAFAAHYYKTAGEMDLMGDLPGLHDIPHVTPDMIDMLKSMRQ